jgi:hypothetical protein
LLVIYTPSHVCSVRNPGLARRLAEGLAPKRETRVTIAPPFLALRSEVLKQEQYSYVTAACPRVVCAQPSALRSAKPSVPLG